MLFQNKISVFFCYSLKLSELTQALAEKMEEKNKKKKKKRSKRKKKKSKKVKKVGEDEEVEVRRVEKEEEFGGKFSRMVSRRFAATYLATSLFRNCIYFSLCL